MEGSALRYVGSGTIAPATSSAFPERLKAIHDGIRQVLEKHQPHEAAIEETFVNVNPASTLKLGQARGAALLTLSLAGLVIGEYPARTVKQSVTGTGRAEKKQMGVMVQHLLPTAKNLAADEADALAIAICHAHYRGRKKLESAA